MKKIKNNKKLPTFKKEAEILTNESSRRGKVSPVSLFTTVILDVTKLNLT